MKAGAPVDATVAQLAEYMEPGDIIIDGGNEWCAGAWDALSSCWGWCCFAALKPCVSNRLKNSCLCPPCCLSGTRTRSGGRR